jgi:hypothetical protein
MTPYGGGIQQVNGAPHTTPAEKGLKIGPRAYCGHLIFSGPLLRTSLNDGLQIAVGHFAHKRVCSSLFDKYLISDDSLRAKKGDYEVGYSN